jgi:hypothetical protein
MRRHLLVALWPLGQAAIAATTVAAARREPREGASRAARSVPLRAVDIGELAASLGLADGTGRLGSALRGAASRGGRTAGRRPPSPPASPGWIRDLAWLAAISCAGGVSSYGVMALLGRTVVTRGPAIDEPIVRWTSSNQVDWWAPVVERLGKIGNTWTTWGAAGAAAACLAVTWPKSKWVPPASLGAAILVDHYATLALRRKFRRAGPPDSPGGTYPSGGCDRTVFLYGLIAYLLWREFSGTQRGKAWAIGAVTALSFNEAYARQYLSKHWFTDILSGLLYGTLLLGPFIAGVRLVAGPPAPPGGKAGAR